MNHAANALLCHLCFCVCMLAQVARAQTERDETRQDEPSALQIGDVSEQQKKAMLSHLRQHHRPAVNFVVDQFQKHDVVLLGENHQVADNCRFVSSLLEPLYHKGVRTLAWEFTRSSFNEEIARLITANEFDNELANQLLRRGPWTTWGFQEYVDILHSAWRLNQKLPPDAKRFRIIALDSDWSQYELWFGKLNRVQIFQKIVDREKHMTKILKTETIEKNEKVLVHIGYAHTLTRHGSRLGKVLTDEFGSRVKQVALHQSWHGPDGKAPLGDFLDRLALEAGGGEPIGFDVASTPLGRLTDSSAGVFRFAAKDATLADVSQGYVFLKPLKELRGVKWIPGFIVNENFAQARAIAIRMQWIGKDAATTPNELNAALRQRFRGERFSK